MKKRSTAIIICIIFACSIAIGMGAAGMRLTAEASSNNAISNLKKLKKVVKKKKKLSKVYKTEEHGTGSIDWMYYKHKAQIKTKGNKIYFKDHIYYKQRKLTIGEYTVSMVMKVGANDTVTAKVQETEYKWRYRYDYGDAIKSAKKGKKKPTQTLEMDPTTYNYSESLEDEDSFEYHAQLHTAMRCWNKLIAKKAKLSMKKIGFEEFKGKSIHDEGEYYMK